MARDLNAKRNTKIYIPKFLEDSSTKALKTSLEKELHDISNTFQSLKVVPDTVVTSVNGMHGDVVVSGGGGSSATRNIVTYEALSAGDLVNVFNDGGILKVRKSNGLNTNQESHGFVLANYPVGTEAVVNFGGLNTAASGLTIGVQYLSYTNPGKTTNIPPTISNKIFQPVGIAVASNVLVYQFSTPIYLV